MAASPSKPLASLGKLTELKQRLLFVVGALVVFRLGSFIPLPGVDPARMTELIKSSGGLLDMFNMFSGGALERMSVFALGVIPYISAAIVVQMFTAVIPSWKALQKEGESGRQTLTNYTRMGTLGLSIFQSFGVASMLQLQQGVVYAPGPSFVLTTIVGLTTGTMFLMWLGEQMTERGVGNGISLLIFAGIVAGLPAAVVHTLGMAQTGEMTVLRVLIIFLLVLAVTYFVVFVESGQRRITVNYARRQGGAGRAYMNQSSHLPLKINMSGVIPPIFASSLIMFPATAATWLTGANEVRWLQVMTASLAPGQPLQMLLYGAMIVIFTFFYTALVFNSQETADNLKRSGALIPGLRPGRATADYIDAVLTRLTGAAAVYLVVVCLIPDLLRAKWQVPFYFGGTSLLIVVVVVMDFTAQVQAHLVSHQYESLLKKANLRGR